MMIISLLKFYDITAFLEVILYYITIGGIDILPWSYIHLLFILLLYSIFLSYIYLLLYLHILYISFLYYIISILFIYYRTIVKKSYTMNSSSCYRISFLFYLDLLLWYRRYLWLLYINLLYLVYLRLFIYHIWYMNNRIL